MKYISVTILLIAAVIASLSFSINDESPQEKIKAWFSAQYKILAGKLEVLKIAVEENKEEKIIRENFVQARLAYKQLELLIAYYFELEVNKFNGPPVDFVEEEDPSADQVPQGFQVIESFIYPHYDTANRGKLLEYSTTLSALASALSTNSYLFEPDQYCLDAAMEEMYRVITLGITGFDAPLSQQSMPEATAALNSVQFIIKAYEKEINGVDKRSFKKVMRLLTDAQTYLEKHADFNSFNRMVFITEFIDPACSILGDVGIKTGLINNIARISAIEKKSHLFDANSIRAASFLYDDTVTIDKIALGKKLFYENLLSANGKRSCAGCHKPELGFTDGLPTALELDEHSKLPRNTPTLWNAYLQMNLFADSRQATLDHLIMEVLGNEKEMNSGADVAAKKLTEQPAYTELYHKAYPGVGTPISGKQLVNAISMYLRTLTSYNSRFDKYFRGNKKEMNAAEINGFNLFMGKARCGICHFAPFFSGSKPPTFYYQESEVIGVPATTDTLHAVLDSDEGRYFTTKREFHKHAFKTPTLRNIALTAPYMHNGVYKTLEEVLDFYNKGGGAGLGIAPENLTLQPDKLNLTPQEMKDIIAFLKTLTDTSALDDTRTH
jgi:cytochrome c peroxidase